MAEGVEVTGGVGDPKSMREMISRIKALGAQPTDEQLAEIGVSRVTGYSRLMDSEKT